MRIPEPGRDLVSELRKLKEILNPEERRKPRFCGLASVVSPLKRQDAPRLEGPTFRV